MDATFLFDGVLRSEDTAILDAAIKEITGKVTGITLMLYTYPVVVICHLSEELTEDEKVNIYGFIGSYSPI